LALCWVWHMSLRGVRAILRTDGEPRGAVLGVWRERAL